MALNRAGSGVPAGRSAATRGEIPAGAGGSLPEGWCAVCSNRFGLTAEAPTGVKARERWEALSALADLVDEEVAARPDIDLPALVAELRVRADARHPPTVQGVTLASLHAAKGLQVGCGVPGGPGRRHPADLAHPLSTPTARPSRRNAACSMSGSPGREPIWNSAGRWPAHTGRTAESQSRPDS